MRSFETFISKPSTNCIVDVQIIFIKVYDSDESNWIFLTSDLYIHPSSFRTVLSVIQNNLNGDERALQNIDF